MHSVFIERQKSPAARSTEPYSVKHNKDPTSVSATSTSIKNSRKETMLLVSRCHIANPQAEATTEIALNNTGNKDIHNRQYMG
jgi:hypothetical protein